MVGAVLVVDGGIAIGIGSDWIGGRVVLTIAMREFTAAMIAATIIIRAY